MKIKDPYAEFQHAELENGLSVYHLQTDNNFTYMTFNLHSGASSDPIGREGMAHFVEHLMGEKALVPDEAIPRFFENLGGSVMLGTTWSFMTRYSFTVPTRTDYLQSSLLLFGEMLLKGEIISGVEKHRQIILNEYKRKITVEEIYDIDRQIYRTLFPGGFFSRALSPLGTKSFIETATKVELNNFFKKHYVPANMTIVSCGSMSFEEMKGLILNSVFGSKDLLDFDQECVTRVNKDKTILQPLEHEVNTLEYCISEIEKSEIKRTSCKYNAYALLPHENNLEVGLVLSLMLSRALNEKIREKDTKTYSIYSNHSFDGEGRYISIECTSFDIDYYDKMIDSVLGVIDSLKNNEELFLSAVKKKKNLILMSDETSKDIVGISGKEIVLYGKIMTAKECLDSYDSITMQDINEVLKYLKDKFMLHVLVKP